MRHILTFKTSFPESFPSPEYHEPRGYSICEYLHTELARAGFNVEAVDNYDDIAWSADCVINDKRVFFFVGYLGTKVTDWQLIVCSGVGLIGRLLGRKDQDERIKLAQTIHAILSADERFSELKWFSRYTDSPNDPWSAQPT